MIAGGTYNVKYAGVDLGECRINTATYEVDRIETPSAITVVIIIRQYTTDAERQAIQDAADRFGFGPGKQVPEKRPPEPLIRVVWPTPYTFVTLENGFPGQVDRDLNPLRRAPDFCDRA